MKFRKIIKTIIGSIISKTTANSVLFIDGNNKLAEDNANLFWDIGESRLMPARLGVQSSLGVELPIGDAFAFTIVGSPTTGLRFNTVINHFEFVRDGIVTASISAENTLTHSFKSVALVALLIANNSYAFALSESTNTGLFFNNVTGKIELHNAGAPKHLFDVITGEYTINPGTKQDGLLIGDTAEIQTTQATATPINPLTLLDENTYHIEAIVIGVKSDGTDRASYQLSATIYRTAGGSAVIQGQTIIHSVESNAAWDATFIVAGNQAAVQVTGVVATTIEWVCTYRCINMSK